MATLTIIPYAPKPQKHHIQNRPSKPVIQQTSPLDKNPRIDPSDVSITVPPTLIGAVVNNWCQKGGGNSEVAAQDVQPYGDNLVGARAASVPEIEDSNVDNHDEFLSLARLLSSKCKDISERSGVQSTIEKSDDQALHNRPGFSGLKAVGSHDDPIALESDDKLDDDNGKICAEPASRTLEHGRPGNDTFHPESKPTLPNRTSNEYNVTNIGIDNFKSPQTAKRKKSARPRRDSVLCHASTSPLPCNEDHKENSDQSNSDTSEDDHSCSKRQKVSVLQIGRIVVNSRQNRRQRSPSSTSEDDNGTRGISVDGRPATIAKTTVAPESDSPIEPKLYTQVIDTDQDWEVRQIVGKEHIDGVLHYMVDWHPTLMPGHLLGHAKELVDKFEARLLRKDKGRGKLGLKQRRGR